MNRRKILAVVRRNVAAEYPAKSWRLDVRESYDEKGYVIAGYKRVLAFGILDDRTFYVQAIATDELLNSKMAAVNDFLAQSLSECALHFLRAQP